MSTPYTQNPQLQPSEPPHWNSTLQPDAPDFVETPDVDPTPLSEHEPLPVWLYVVCGFALFMAGSSFAGFGAPGLFDQGPDAAIVATSAVSGLSSAPLDPMDMGKQVYSGNCANCHQASGEGQPGSYPPLGGSEFVLGDKTTLACIMLHGLQGPVTVKGGEYGSQQMPGWATVLNDAKIAAVMTYIRASWGNKGDAVKPDEISAARAQSADHSDAYTKDTLKQAAAGKK